MNENKRYYWLKLYKDFFTSKRIKMLRTIAGGDTYTIIYLKMQLKALETNGYLYFDGYMNNFAEELAIDIDENVDNVKITIQYLMNVGLLESNTNETEYKLTFMENVVGSETASTQRSRVSRGNAKMLQCNKNATEVQQLCNTEKDIEKDIEKDKDNIAKRKPQKHKYGQYQHVLLTDEQLLKLKAEYPNYLDLITYLDEYIEMKGYKAKNHYLAIKKWVVDAVSREKNKMPDFNLKEPKHYTIDTTELDKALEEIENELRNKADERNL